MIWGIRVTIFLIILFIIINFILNITILPYFEIMGVVPNISIAVVVVIALLNGRYYGGFFGIFIGILHDIFFASHIGVNPFIYFFIGYLIGYMYDIFTRDNILNPIIFTGLATIFYNLTYFVFLYFLNIEFTSSYLFQRVISIELIYNSLISIVIYKKFKKIFDQPRLRYSRNKR